jgi:hypothetical protein
VAVAIGGCGPDLATRTFVERCGEVGPIQLLGLAPHETAEGDTADSWIVHAVEAGDRWLVGVREYDVPLGPDSWIGADGDLEDAPVVVSSRIVSVDECGGDPRVVAEGASHIRPPRGAEPWIACTEDHRIVVFDPEVEGPGRAHPDLWCTDDVVDGDFLTSRRVEGELPMVVRATLGPDGTRTLRELGIALRYPRDKPAPEATALTFMIDTSDRLLEVNVHTGTSNVLRQGVARFYISDDGRFVQWSPETNASGYEGTWYLWDRTTDEERQLTVDGQTVVTSYWIRNGIASYFVETGPWQFDQRLEWLDTDESAALDGLWDVEGRFADQSVLGTAGEVGVFDHASGSFRTVYDDSLNGAWATEDGVRGYGPLGDPLGNRRTLLELTAPDFEPRVVVWDVYYPMHLADGRWLTVRGTERATPVPYGTLVAVAERGDAVVIDEDVASTLHEFNGGDRYHEPPPELERTVVYAVRDLEQTRTGVWLAELAP